MIGDALSDVAAGRAFGARTVLMLTGVTTREMVDALPLPSGRRGSPRTATSLRESSRSSRPRQSRRRRNPRFVDRVCVG